MAQLVASKHATLAALAHQSTTVVAGMDGWIHNHKSMIATVDSHTDAIASLGTSLRLVEQQLKAIARVMATQDLGHMIQSRDEALNNMRAEILKITSDRSSEMLSRLNNELMNISTDRQEVSQKIASLQSSVMEAVQHKSGELTKAHNNLEEVVSKLEYKTQSLENLVKELFERAQSYTDTKNSDVKRLIQALQSTIAAERKKDTASFIQSEQDRAKLREWANETIASAKSDFDQRVRALESTFTERHNQMTIALEKASREASEVEKLTSEKARDIVHAARVDIEKLMSHQERDMERKVHMIGRQVMELKKGLDQDRANSENEASAFRQALREEKQARDTDEEKMLAMITHCMTSLDKLHRS